MEATIQTTITVNGAAVTRAVPARQHLIDFLRETLGLTGSHVGCEHGVCGACTVRVDGEIVRGCLMLAVQAHGRKVDTIEGLSDSGELADLQECFHQHNALQCGFCTPGMLLAAQDLMRTKPHATRDEIREYMAGNYCRCTGYHAIVDAVEEALARRAKRRRARGSEEMNARAELPLHAPGTQVDKGYIGQSVPRPNAKRLLQGRGAFVDDLRFPRLAHVVFFRSPYAHAKVKKLDLTKAARQPGVIAVLRRPRGGRVLHALGRGARAPEGHQVGGAVRDRDRARVLAGRSGRRGRRGNARAGRGRARPRRRRMGRAAGRDRHGGCALPASYVIHPDLGDNICFKRELDTGGVDDAFAKADVVVEETYDFGRHTGVCLEAARDPRRLQRRRALADRVPLDAGAAHDAGHLLAPPRHPRGATCG